MLIMLGGGGKGGKGGGRGRKGGRGKGEGEKAFLSQIRKTGKGYLKRSGL